MHKTEQNPSKINALLEGNLFSKDAAIGGILGFARVRGIVGIASERNKAQHKNPCELFFVFSIFARRGKLELIRG